MFLQLIDSFSKADWTKLRDRWEYLHVARAGFVLLSLRALVQMRACRKRLGEGGGLGLRRTIPERVAAMLH